MIELNAPTAILWALVPHLVLVGVLALYAGLQKTYDGFRSWVLAAFVSSFGGVALLARPLIPLVLSVVVTNGCIAAGMMLTLDGMLRFVRGRPLAWGWHLVPWALAAAQAGQALLADDLMVRQLVWVAVSVAGYGAMGSVLLKGGGAEGRTIYRAFAGVQFLQAACYLGYAADWLLGPRWSDLLEPGNPAAYMAVFISVMDLANLAGYLLLNGHRLEMDLRASQEAVERALVDLRKSLAQVKVLSGLLPICAHCKKIRDGDGGWQPVELYVGQRTDTRFAPDLCPACAVLPPDLVEGT